MNIFCVYVDYRPLFYRLLNLKYFIMTDNEKQELKKLGNKLRLFRLNKNISQEKLAEITNLDRTYISSLERGKRNPSFLILKKLAECLDVNPNDFFL